MARRVTNKPIAENYKKIQEAYAKSLREIEKLKEQRANSHDKEVEKSIGVMISENETRFRAQELLDKGDVYSYRGEYAEAIDVFRQALSISVDDTQKYLALSGQQLVYLGRGLDYIDNKQYDEAIKDFSSSIALVPNDAVNYMARGSAYHAQKNDKSALSDYSQAIALDPKNAMAYGMRAQLEQEMGARLQRADVEERSMVITDRGKLKHALEDINQAIALEPNNGQWYYVRGEIKLYMQMKRSSQQSDFQKACDMGAEDACGMIRVFKHMDEMVTDIKTKRSQKDKKGFTLDPPPPQ